MFRKKRYLLLALILFPFFLFLSHKGEENVNSIFPVIEEKPFVVIVPSYNQSPFVEKTLLSVLTQKYTNYRVIFIDDHSVDGTYEKAQSLVDAFDRNQRVSLVRNLQTLGPLCNIYNAIFSCHDHEIALLLKGSDALAHQNVLSFLNQTYANSQTWATFGSGISYPNFASYLKATSSPSRKSPLSVPPPLSFYTALFKQIALPDLFFQGRFFPMGWEEALFFPLLEMGGDHFQPLSEILYLSHTQDPLSDQNVDPGFQKTCRKAVYAKTPYKPLKCLPPTDGLPLSQVDLIIFARNQCPLQLYALLESLHLYGKGVEEISILYKRPSINLEGRNLEKGYTEVQKAFPSVHFIPYTHHNFAPLFLKAAFASSITQSAYIAFATDNLLLKAPVDFSEPLKSLGETKAYGVFLSHFEGMKYSTQLSRYQPSPVTTPLIGVAGGDIPLAWQFAGSADDWSHAASFDLALYKKSELKPLFERLDFNSPEELLRNWELHTPQDALGLFYPKAKGICLNPQNPLKERLEIFLGGLKMELEPLFDTLSSSQEISVELSYVPRD